MTVRRSVHKWKSSIRLCKDMIRSLIKDSFIYALSGAVGQLLGILLLPLYTRIFSVEQYGVLTLLLLSVTIIVTIISMQMYQSVARFYISARSRKKKQAIVTTALVYYLFAFGIFCILGSAISIFLSTLYACCPSYFDTDLILIFFVFIFVNALFLFNVSLFKWRFQSQLMAIFSISNVILSAALVVISILYFHLGIAGVFLGQSLSSTILNIIMMYLLRQEFNFHVVSKKTFYVMLAFGAPLVFSALSIYLMQSIDRFIIERFLGLGAVGIYVVGAKIAGGVALVLSGFQMAWGPFTYRTYEKDGANVQFAYILRIVFILLMGCLLVAGLYSQEAVLLLASNAFKTASLVIPFMVLAAILNSVANYFAVGMYLAKKNILRMYVNFIGLLANLLLNVILIPYLGIVGSALAMCLSFFILVLFSLYFSQKLYFVPHQYGGYLLSFIAVVVLMMLSTFFFGSKISMIYIGIKFLLVILFFSLCWRLGWLPKSKTVISSKI